MTRFPGPILAIALALCLAVPAAAQQTPFRPVATVNDGVITAFDVEQRVRLLRLLGAQAASADALRRLALQELVDDRLKVAAGAEAGLRPSEENIAEARAEVAAGLDLTTAELDALMANQGITDQAMDDFVAAEATWQSLVRTRFANRIEPGDAEIDNEIALVAGTGENDYRIQEIGLPLTEGERDAAAPRALAETIRAEATDRDAFAAAARRYSRAPSAEAGGDIGWVSGTTLPPELRERLAGAAPGEVVAPIAVPGGLSLVRLVDRRERSAIALDAEDPAFRERVRERIRENQGARLAEGLLQELRRDAIIEIR
ncbi:MAG: peptidylprolyl isomerase [Paracoccaceae bacterium]